LKPVFAFRQHHQRTPLPSRIATMTQMTKKAWSKPERIVLVRGKPEEAILGACKDNVTQANANNDASGCSVQCVSDCLNSASS
jgi:hypothetical protein